MSLVKVGIIGVGNKGKSYAFQLYKGLVKNAVLTAVCGREKQKNWVKENLTDKVQFYQDENAFFVESGIEAVIIATPHYSHPDLAKKAFTNGMHVLLEKPAGVYSKNVIEMNEMSTKSGKVFAIMHNQRTNPLYQKLRHLIQSGELGEIKRINWTITDWYRSQSYYDLNTWRATWAGEGGGVLLNQASHQLDLLLWTTGLIPKRVHAFCHIGKYHEIEVEDDVTAYIEFENGATGVFITSTGEAPGTNRFEIAGDHGKVVVEDQSLTFFRLTQSEREFNAMFKGGFGAPTYTQTDIQIKGEELGHLGIIQNWINAIVDKYVLIAPGEEGIKSLELINSIYLSSWLNKTLELPINEDFYFNKLMEKMGKSTF
ncbi:Gfo/Idh/MocA family protein [Metabacillus halosaccharovorans]|uniref:Gfo/Idh/MocA family protein n=1 Tax=Metabacillus halosaccharovorans TaxID=930124 RepID=UPI001C1F92AA|nr:Gfo/Idh/MocA family oxidoreductase [Metabacillus halosaccharovorans]